MKDHYQKIKLLILYNILRLESDEANPLATNVLVKKLYEYGITVDRRTLKEDIETLNQFGYEVMETQLGHSHAFYVEDRTFSMSELKILIDALQAANFVTNKKTEEMIQKIAALGGIHQAKLLQSNRIVFNTRKHQNESILYNVETIEEALESNKKISFYYFDINAKKQKIYRKDKKLYIVDPISMVFLEDNYYLMTYNTKYNQTTNYRIDRMENVTILEEDIVPIAIDLRGELSDYTKYCFKMYHGDMIETTLRFQPSILNSIYDKFGEDVKIREKRGQYEATVKVQSSPTFFGWLFTFHNQIRILQPESLIEEYKDYLYKTIELYE